MSGSDFFEQELKGRLEEYVMRPSEELWAKIESALPSQEKRNFFLKKYVVLLPLLIFSFSISNQQSLPGNHLLLNDETPSDHTYTATTNTKRSLTRKYSGFNFSSPGAMKERIKIPVTSTTLANLNSSDYSLRLISGLLYHKKSLLPNKYNLVPAPIITLKASQTEKHNSQPLNSDQLITQTPEVKIKKEKKKKAFYVYFSPTISDRSFVQKNKFSYAGFSNNTYNKGISHDPALGWETGFAYVKSVRPGIQIRSGLQVNFSCYTITASQGAPELTSLTQSGIRRIQRISNLENRDGFKNQKYANSSYQVSVPIGFMVRVHQKAKSSMLMGISLQPSYQVLASAYLLSSNYRNYVEAPDMLRKFNIFSGAELMYSYKAGNYRLIAGPQIRYQLLSGHKKEYSFRENLIDYGLKLGIIKELP